jgi:hypothetical protein
MIPELGIIGSTNCLGSSHIFKELAGAVAVMVQAGAILGLRGVGPNRTITSNLVTAPQTKLNQNETGDGYSR